MTTIASRFFNDSSAGFLYVAPVALVYLYTITSQDVLLGGALASLASGVFIHGFLRSISGPGGFSDNPLHRDEKIRRMQAAIWDVGASDDYPASFWEGIWTDHKKRSRLPILGLLVLSNVTTAAAYFISVFYLVQNVFILDFLGFVLLLALVLWFFQVVLWQVWSSIYLEEQRINDRPDHQEIVRKEMNRFGHFIHDETNLNRNRVNYKQNNGAVFHAEFKSPKEAGTFDDETIDTLAQAFVAFLERVEFPIEELHAFLEFNDGSVVQLEIKSEWVEQYKNSDQSYRDYMENVVGTLAHVENPERTQ